jgi:hypothetical protein
MSVTVLMGKLEEIDHLEDAGIDGRTIFKMDLQEMGRRDIDWIELAQDRDMWRALENAVMNLWIP